MGVVKIKVTADVLELFRDRRIFTQPYGKERLPIGHEIGVDEDAAIEAYSNFFSGNRLPFALGAFSYSYSSLAVDLAIARYCSIAHNLSLMGSRHPMDWSSTSPFSYFPHPVGSIRAYLTDRGVKSFPLHDFDGGIAKVTIGNDVWIGEQVMLKRGIAIGDGAIVGARSIVTRDVPPYAVVAGAPARILRYRFPDALIERFQAARWWHFGPDLVQPLDVRDPERFLDRLDTAVAGGATPLDLPILTGAQIIAAARA